MLIAWDHLERERAYHADRANHAHLKMAAALRDAENAILNIASSDDHEEAVGWAEQYIDTWGKESDYD
jgi:hypothetical protein